MKDFELSFNFNKPISIIYNEIVTLIDTYIRISIALQKLESSGVRAFINGHPVAADNSKYLWFSLAQVVVELTPKQRLSMIFLYTTAVEMYIII